MDKVYSFLTGEVTPVADKEQLLQPILDTMHRPLNPAETATPLYLRLRAQILRSVHWSTIVREDDWIHLGNRLYRVEDRLLASYLVGTAVCRGVAEAMGYVFESIKSCLLANAEIALLEGDIDVLNFTWAKGLPI